MYRGVRMCPEVSGWAQRCQDVSRVFKGVYRGHRACPEVSGRAQRCQDVYRGVKVCIEVPEHVQRCRDVSTGVRVCQKITLCHCCFIGIQGRPKWAQHNVFFF